MHISQMHPLGLVKIFHFEFVMRSMKKCPRLGLFHTFFKFKKENGWYSFDKRNASKNLLGKVPSSSADKDWKSKFFFVDAGVIPCNMRFRLKGEQVVDEAPLAAEVNSGEYQA